MKALQGRPWWSTLCQIDYFSANSAVHVEEGTAQKYLFMDEFSGLQYAFPVKLFLQVYFKEVRTDLDDCNRDYQLKYPPYHIFDQEWKGICSMADSPSPWSVATLLALASLAIQPKRSAYRGLMITWRFAYHVPPLTVIATHIPSQIPSPLIHWLTYTWSVPRQQIRDYFILVLLHFYVRKYSLVTVCFSPFTRRG